MDFCLLSSTVVSFIYLSTFHKFTPSTRTFFPPQDSRIGSPNRSPSPEFCKFTTDPLKHFFYLIVLMIFFILHQRAEVEDLEKEVNKLRDLSERQAKHIVALEKAQSCSALEKEKAFNEAHSKVDDPLSMFFMPSLDAHLIPSFTDPKTIFIATYL